MAERILERIDAIVAEVNACAAALSWLDFHVARYEPPTLVLSASAEAESWSDLRIAFRDVHWACLRFDRWSCRTHRPVLERADGDEARAVRQRFRLEVGYHLFRFTADESPEPLWIAAREITADLRRLTS